MGAILVRHGPSLILFTQCPCNAHAQSRRTSWLRWPMTRPTRQSVPCAALKARGPRPSFHVTEPEPATEETHVVQ